MCIIRVCIMCGRPTYGAVLGLAADSTDCYVMALGGMNDSK